MSTIPQLTYFDIRGRAEPIRLILEDNEVTFEDNQITLAEWPELRSTTPFRRMPVYREGDLVIAESFAIMRYLGRRYGLLGEDEAASVRCDVAVEAWRDYGNRVGNVFGALSTSESARERFIATEQPALLNDLQAFYLEKATTEPYWAGNSLSIADFTAFHLIEGMTNQFPELLAQFGALQEYYQFFSRRPRIKEYLASSRRPAAIFYGPNGKIYPR
jgi:glutathione S-transferase